MGFRDGPKGGGKKGPRQLGHTFKTKVKLRPAPQLPFLDASGPTASSSKAVKGKGKQRTEYDDDEVEHESADEGEDEDEFNSRADLSTEKRPLFGTRITVTGCPNKAELMALVTELGGEADQSLTDAATHLVALGPIQPSAKLDSALIYGVKVMTPEWLPALQQAWREGLVVDLATMENEYCMTPFYNLHFSLTGFARGDHKTDFSFSLSSNGATVNPKVSGTTTHLIVASPHSPHSQADLNKDKIDSARKHKIKIVWEGWAIEVLKTGGVLSDRLEYWAWKEGSTEPVVDVSEVGREASLMDELEAGSQASETSRKRLDPSTFLDLNTLAGDDEATVAVSRKAVPKNRKREILAVSSLVEAGSVADTSTALPPIDQPSLTIDFEKLPNDISSAAPPLPPLPVPAPKSASASIIRRLASSKSTSFRSSSPPSRSKMALPIQTPNAHNDSGFHDSIPEVGEATEAVFDPYQSQIFKNLTFALMGLREQVVSVQSALEAYGGTVWVDEEESAADYVIVPFFGARAEYRNSSDDRVVTPVWIEHCMYDDKLSPPRDRLLERPLPYDVPVPGGELMNIHTSSCTDVEKAHIKRFVEGHGGFFGNSLDKTRSHFLHPDGDDTSVELAGLKATKARKWGIPIIGPMWLKRWGEEQAKLRPVGPLAGCVVAFATKAECDQRNLVPMLEEPGAAVAVSYHSGVTHLVFSGPKASATFKEFKTRPASLSIVHPAWIEQCHKANKRMSESDYPITYDPRKAGQLAGLVSSPPARRSTSALSSSSSLSQLNLGAVSTPKRDSSPSKRASSAPAPSVLAVANQPKIANAVEERAMPTSATADAQRPALEVEDSQEPTRILRAQASDLLALVEAVSAEQPRRKPRLAKAASAILATPTPNENVSVRRRIPGQGYETQETQVEEESYGVRYVDPAEARARAKIEAALRVRSPEKKRPPEGESVLEGEPPAQRSRI